MISQSDVPCFLVVFVVVSLFPIHFSLCLLTTPSVRLDAQFQVVGAPYSLLSVSLSASQNLYTRRGTLVGLSGKAENVY